MINLYLNARTQLVTLEQFEVAVIRSNLLGRLVYKGDWAHLLLAPEQNCTYIELIGTGKPVYRPSTNMDYYKFYKLNTQEKETSTIRNMDTIQNKRLKCV